MVRILVLVGILFLAYRVGSARGDTPGTLVPTVTGTPPLSSMIVFGDSKNVGVFADTVRGSKLTGRLAQQVTLTAAGMRYARFVEGLFPEAREFPMNWGFLYDQQKLLTHTELTPFAGTRDWSHRVRLERLQLKPLPVHNVSFGGGAMRFFDVQYDRLLHDARVTFRELGSPYIVMDMGAVDLVMGETAEDFLKHYEKALRRIVRMSPRARILVMEVPDAYKAARSHLRAPALQVGNSMKTCKEAQDLIGLTHFLDAGEATARARFEAMNAGLARLVESVRAGELGSFDGSITLAPYPELEAIQAVDGFAFDCWHPNEKANAVIAEKAWEHARVLFESPAAP